jgi:ferrous-iron efflux pump FieF
MLGEAERRRERAVALTVVLDLLLLAPYVAVGILAASWTMIAEATRGGLLIVVGIISLLALRRIHRGRTGNYEYGVGKLEQTIASMIAALLLLAAGMILWRVALMEPSQPPDRLMAIVAVVFVVINLALNTTQAVSLHRASRDHASIIVTAQCRARIAKAIGSLVVVACVAFGMFVDDPLLARRADQIGAVSVVCLMVASGVGMLRESLPDLLDQALPEPEQRAINRVLARHFAAYDDLGRVRTRRSGNVLHVEITLRLPSATSLAAATSLADTMQEELRREIPGVDPVVVTRA